MCDHLLSIHRVQKGASQPKISGRVGGILGYSCLYLDLLVWWIQQTIICLAWPTLRCLRCFDFLSSVGCGVFSLGRSAHGERCMIHVQVCQLSRGDYHLKPFLSGWSLWLGLRRQICCCSGASCSRLVGLAWCIQGNRQSMWQWSSSCLKSRLVYANRDWCDAQVCWSWLEWIFVVLLSGRCRRCWFHHVHLNILSRGWEVGWGPKKYSSVDDGH